MYSKPFVLFGLVWGFVVVCGCGSENTPPAESSQDVGDARVDAVVDAGPQDGGGEDAPDVPSESLEIVLELERLVVRDRRQVEPAPTARQVGVPLVLPVARWDKIPARHGRHHERILLFKDIDHSTINSSFSTFHFV